MNNQQQLQQVLKSVSGPVFRGGMLSIGIDSQEKLPRIHSTQIFQQTLPIETSQFDFETGQFNEPIILESESSVIGEIKPTFVLKTSTDKRATLNYLPQNLDTASTQIMYGHNSEIVRGLVHQPDSTLKDPIVYKYKGCCWFNLQPDNVISDVDESNSTQNLSENFEDRNLNFKMRGVIMNSTHKNPSPRMIVPSQWFLNQGCDSALKLNPFISNKNLLKCRWATYLEALGGAYDPNIWPSISLTDDCLLTYNASKDSSLAGMKPIAIMLEDFDSDGNLQNSVPIQFTAGKLPSLYVEEAVKTPEEVTTLECENIPILKSIVNLKTQESLLSETGSDYGDFINKEIDIYAGGKAAFEISYWTAQSTHFHFEGPTGISCDKITDELKNEKLQCNWAPSHDDWHLEETNFCFVAIGHGFFSRYTL